MKLFDQTFATLEHALDVRVAKQARLAANIANLDTPGYTPTDVDFEASMEAFAASTSSDSSATAKMSATASGHLDVNGVAAKEIVKPVVAEDLLAKPTLDDNSVDLDHTMAELAENTTQYSVATRVLRKKLAMMRYVASDGSA